MAQILAPLRGRDDINITILPITPCEPYPFPWPFFRFLDVFPESIYQVAPPIQTLPLSDSDKFDLIILPYAVWYLAPSLPAQALLQNPQFQAVAKGAPVITVIACRNMWHLAQESVKQALAAMGARLIDNIVLTDQGGTFASFITVPRWLWTGRSNAFWGLPAAGTHPDEIKRARRFGLALRDALQQDLEKKDAPLLSGLEAVTAEPTLLVSERAATRSFKLWGKLVRAFGQPKAAARVPVLFLYVIFLITLILTVVPISLLLQRLLRPLLRSKLAAAKRYYEMPSGSDKDRLTTYE
ncbi:MAG TPA: dialkylresorcinol condensing enzyme [Cellvibrio sp.]|nr:dialkylresorcinol condensing enzyme [Cellvibrio sp.]